MNNKYENHTATYILFPFNFINAIVFYGKLRNVIFVTMVPVVVGKRALFQGDVSRRPAMHGVFLCRFHFLWQQNCVDLKTK